ncbi:MAG: hypothetical protein HRU19_03870 [Pseudobacteriovorax sp.]|nr:hypothetical protein [Pseudobacteriovorax sp.]
MIEKDHKLAKQIDRLKEIDQKLNLLIEQKKGMIEVTDIANEKTKDQNHYKN